MYARLRQKIAITTYTQTVVSSGTGTNAASVLMKDIARVICGKVTSVNDLNPAVWDIPNCEIVASVAPGWDEYQSNYLTTATNIPIDTVGNANIIYFRAPSGKQSLNGGIIYKYSGLGFMGNNSGAVVPTFNIFPSWTVNDYTAANPVLTYRSNASAGLDQINARNAFNGSRCEYIISSNPKMFVISATIIGSNATISSKVSGMFEFPPTALSELYDFPNHMFWEVSNGSGGALVANSTGLGSFSQSSSTYQIQGGWNPLFTSDTSFSSSGLLLASANVGYVYSTVPGGTGWTAIWPNSSTINALAPSLSTLKPPVFTSMSNTFDASGNIISVPLLPLIHYPAFDSMYDISSLTGFYGTKSGIAANGDTININGRPYAYINATNMGYLVPRE